MRKKAIVLGTCIILFIGVLSSQMGRFRAGTDLGDTGMQNDGYEYHYINAPNEVESMDESDSNSTEKPKEYIQVDTDPDSYTVLVNRKYLISKDYVPADLVVPNIAFSFSGTYEKSYMRIGAAAALERLFQGAAKKGYYLKGVSAYRSYERQEQIYRANVYKKGRDNANKVSAIPGSSEHQTGLTIDVSCNSVNCTLEESFGETAEGKWLKRNCYKYGFIIRYPKNKTKITGYSYEPWHIRYVGKNLAEYLYKNKLTLEEYYQQTTVEEQVARDPVEDIDTMPTNEPEMKVPPTPKPTVAPTKSPVMTQTDSPVITATPKATKKPKVTKKPSETASPTATVAPTKTPETTKKPADTKEPVATKEPDATMEPVGTEEPSEQSDAE